MIYGWFKSAGHRLLVIFVYAKSSYIERRDLWWQLINIQVLDFPWLVMGDFNVIRADSKRIGGNPRTLLPMLEFNDYLLQCGLVGLLNSGQQMSW